MWAMQRRSSSNMQRGPWNLWLHSKQCICRLKLPEVGQSILLEKNKYQSAEDWSRTRQSRWIFVFLPAKKKARYEQCRLCRNSKKANLILEKCCSWQGLKESTSTASKLTAYRNKTQHSIKENNKIQSTVKHL